MKILIADDNPTDVFVLKLTLEKWDYKVISCSNGKEAFEILTQEDPPKLAILDWGMPEMTGLEVCQELRFQDLKSYLYVIILSSRTKQDDLLIGLRSGADDYIKKPVDLNELRLRLHAGRRIIDLHESLIAAQEKLQILASQDFLTGIHNRGAAMDTLNREISRASRNKNPLGILTADIDKFKNINDTHGHPAGDSVIKEVAARIQNTLREYDSVGRFGGEEFLVIVPEIQYEDLRSLGNRIRESIANSPIQTLESELSVTMSFGGAILSNGKTLSDDELIAQADTALYAAKEGGRNRIEMAPLAEEEEPGDAQQA